MNYLSLYLFINSGFNHQRKRKIFTFIKAEHEPPRNGFEILLNDANSSPMSPLSWRALFSLN